MPGIVGVLSSERSPHHERSVMAMLSHMTHEPFYDCGTCFSHEIGVYAGWTAHKNSQAALQNQLGSDQAVSVVLAGECVTQEGQSVTDLATLYSRRNSDFIAELNGQFSGLLVDRPGNQAILFNDRYGVERLYVYEAADDVFFASEAKALLAVLPELRRFDDGAVAEFVGFGCTLNWKSLFHSLNFMQGGTSWTLSGGTVRKQRYFDRSTWERQPALRPDAFDSELADTFSRVMPRHVRSDLPVGISLTGGLDTRMIMACLPTAGPEPVCYTFSGQYGATLDERVAAHVAAICQLDHHVLRLNDDFLARFGQYVDRTVYVTDGCSGPMAAHEIYLNSMARQLAPVRLTGNFGSEILRGVSTLKPRRIASALLSDDFRAIVEDKRLECAGPVQHPVAFAVFADIPWRLFGTMAAAKSQLIFRTPYLDNDLVKIAFRAPTTALHSPRPALGLVAKYKPILSTIPTDRELLNNGGVTNRLRRLFAEFTFKLDYLSTEGLPARLSWTDAMTGGLSKLGLLGRHKYLPYRRWFRNELSPYVSEVLTDAQTSRLPYWNPRTLSAMAEDHRSGRQNYTREIDLVLTLEATNRLLIRHRADQHEHDATTGPSVVRCRRA